VNWISANISTATCKAGRGDVCCDLIALKCGIERNDAAKALATPLPYEAKSK